MQVLDDALAAEGRTRSDIEMVGGIRGRFVNANDVASLDEAFEGVREQLDGGYSTICFKPSMFTDDRDDVVQRVRTSRRIPLGVLRYLTRVV
jgi:hypothetical protein